MTQYEVLQKLVNNLAKGYSHSLIVVGNAGIGKTETTISTLKTLGYKEREHYLYLANYITPAGFLDVLEETNKLKNPKVLLLDDIENTLKNPAVIGLLKGALWEAGGKRRVFWRTNQKQIEFEFFGKVIILLNYFNIQNPIINSLKDRADYFEIEVSSSELGQMVLEIARQPHAHIPLSKRTEIAQFVVENGLKSPHFSLRTLSKAFNYFLSSPNHWKELLRELL